MSVVRKLAHPRKWPNIPDLSQLVSAYVCTTHTRLSRKLGGALYNDGRAGAGMTSLLPDFLMLCVCAKTGLDLTTREHFAAALALDMPVFCVVTKSDTVSPAKLERTLRETRQLLAAAADAGAAASAIPAGAAGASANELSELSEQLRGSSSDGGCRVVGSERVSGDVVVSNSAQAPAGGSDAGGDCIGIFDTDDQQEMQEQRQEQVHAFAVQSLRPCITTAL